MRYWYEVYRANLRVAMATMFQYRFVVLIWAVWGFVGPLISLAVWSAVSAARGGTVTNGATSYGRADFASYFLVFMVFGHLTMSWEAFGFFSFRVRNGDLSPMLLRPIHPLHADAASNVSFKIVTSTMLFPIWIALWIMLKPTPPHSALDVLMAVPAVFMAGVLRYIMQYALAILAFWTTRLDAINQLYFTLDSFLAGRIAPLALMPGILGAVAVYSPFRSMGAFPVELALGRVPPEQILPGFALQLGWIVVAICLFNVLWRAGIKQYSAVGA